MSSKNDYFNPVDPKVDFPRMEDELIASWKKNKIFEKSISDKPKDKTWTFLDGPPFITGLPHYGTLLSSIPKDLFPRFWTMKGYSVRRVWGWDCHGLPAENKVENKLGIKRKKDIEEVIMVGGMTRMPLVVKTVEKFSTTNNFFHYNFNASFVDNSYKAIVFNELHFLRPL